MMASADIAADATGAMATAGSTRARAEDLDLFKAVLVYGMVTAHVVQLLGLRLYAANDFSEFINLVSFSGFLFAFGLGTGLSRTGPARVRTPWQRLRPALLLLLGTYGSSIGFVVLVERDPLTPQLLADLFLLRRLFGWSEFLASFFVLYLLMSLARPALLTIANNAAALLAAIAICLASTLLVVPINVPVLATLIGTTSYPSFPLMPYLPWFLLGIHLANSPLRVWHVVPAAAATVTFYASAWITGVAPQRFPPSSLWVIGPALFLLLYLFAARGFATRLRLPDVLLVAGRRVFSFVIISNLVIFTLRYTYGRPVRDVLQAVLVSAAILGALTLCCLVVERLGPMVARRHLARAATGAATKVRRGSS
jgi:hypothetical protein